MIKNHFFYRILLYMLGILLFCSTTLIADQTIKNHSYRSQTLHLGLLGLVQLASSTFLFSTVSDRDKQIWQDANNDVHLIILLSGPAAASFEEARSLLGDLGARIIHVVPQGAYRVIVSSQALPGLLNHAQIAGVMTVPLEAKVSSSLWGRYINGDSFTEDLWSIEIAGSVNPEKVLAQAKISSGKLIAQQRKSTGFIFQMKSDVRRLISLLLLPEVVRVSPTERFSLANDAVRDTVMVDPLRIERPELELYGQGQVIGFLDWGFDAGTDDPALLTDDFEDAAGTGNRIQALIDLGGDNDMSDYGGHGTACAGTALGNGANSTCDPVTRDYEDPGCLAGVAPEAGLVFVANQNSGGGGWSVFPADIADILNPSHDAGTRIHSNSWASMMGDSGYEGYAQGLDAWLFAHQDDLTIFAGGNQGVDNDADGVTDLMNMNQPATAKNTLGVGAMENRRIGYGPFDFPPLTLGSRFPVPPLAGDWEESNSDGMVNWSSRGPTLDGRYKPDISAPGQFLLTVQGYHQYLQSGEHYGNAGGTSLAAPVVGGVAALYRQYFEDFRNRTPSGPLLKALLLLGAKSTAPGEEFAGYPSYVEIPFERPNNVQGWGRVDAKTIIDDLERGRVYTADRALAFENQTWRTVVSLPSEVTDFHAMLAWYDAPGSPLTGGQLVNDLDLTITHLGSGQTYHPNQANPGSSTFIAQYDPWSPWEDIFWFEGTTDPGGADGYAVRFTPNVYPCEVASVGLFLDGVDTTPYQFDVNIYTADVMGEPGTLLYTQEVTIQWPENNRLIIPIPLDAPVPIASGDVFVEYRQRPGSPALFHYNYDRWPDPPQSPNGLSWRWTDAGGWENVTATNYAVRGVFKSAAGSGPQDRVNPQEGIDLVDPPSGLYEVAVYGYRIDQPVPGTLSQPFSLVLWGEGADWQEETGIELLLFTTEPTDESIILNWRTAVEPDNAGFYLQRASTEDGDYLRLKGQLIPAEGDAFSGGEYEFEDRMVNPGETYFYKLEAVDLHGENSFFGPIKATVPESPGFCGLAGDASWAALLALVWLLFPILRKRKRS